MDGSLRGYWRSDARFVRRVWLQCSRRNFRRSDFLRSGLVWLFSKSFQSYAGGHARWRTNRHGPVPMALVTGICGAAVVRLEISELHCLADGDRLAAAHHLVVSQADRRRTAILRSDPGRALDNV